MAVVCEIRDCGIVAVRRCWNCKKAFCLSHQSAATGYYSGEPLDPNLCALCEPEVNRQRAEQEQASSAADRSSREDARSRIHDKLAELVALGSPGRVLAGGNDGWIVGDFTFDHYSHNYGSGKSTNTALVTPDGRVVVYETPGPKGASNSALSYSFTSSFEDVDDALGTLLDRARSDPASLEEATAAVVREWRELKKRWDWEMTPDGERVRRMESELQRLGQTGYDLSRRRRLSKKIDKLVRKSGITRP